MYQSGSNQETETTPTNFQNSLLKIVWKVLKNWKCNKWTLRHHRGSSWGSSDQPLREPRKEGGVTKPSRFGGRTLGLEPPPPPFGGGAQFAGAVSQSVRWGCVCQCCKNCSRLLVLVRKRYWDDTQRDWKLKPWARPLFPLVTASLPSAPCWRSLTASGKGQKGGLEFQSQHHCRMASLK